MRSEKGAANRMAGLKCACAPMDECQDGCLRVIQGQKGCQVASLLQAASLQCQVGNGAHTNLFTPQFRQYKTRKASNISTL